MRFKVNQNVKVVKSCPDTEFLVGDIVKIIKIGMGCEENPVCYECVDTNNLDGLSWYLGENDVELATKADKIKSMTDKELVKFLEMFNSCSRCRRYGNNCFSNIDVETWLKEEFNDEF